MKSIQNTGGSETKAIIYCRVSSAKQRIDGSGLESQEHRCRQYAAMKGYEVEAVFPDDVSGGGDFMKRPGMVALLSYLDAQPGKSYVVIFDDLKRFARDTEFHIKLRREFQMRGAAIECLNFKLDDTPEGKFVETIFAAQGELEREQNRRQVIQKMKARVERGYAVFQAPVGYRYATDRVHGKILVRSEPVASIVQEALEGYAMGRFRSQMEVKRFLDAQPEFPKDLPNGEVRFFKVTRMLKRVTYAGYIEAPEWNVSRRKGHHEGLISYDAFLRIQKYLEQGARGAARKDFSEDFILRGWVYCDECGKAMTACWSKGKTRHYPYYLCDTPKCPAKRKSIPRAKIDDGFEAILRTLQPAPGLFALAKAMLSDAWEARIGEARRARDAALRQVKEIDNNVGELLDRLVDASSPTVVRAYEARIEKLEQEKLLLADRARRALPPPGKLEEFIELALGFLGNPCKIWENGSAQMRRAVLRLAFPEPLRYSLETGYRTPETAYPFKVLAGIFDKNRDMVL